MLRRGIRKEISTSSEPRDHISKMAGGEDTLDTVLSKSMFSLPYKRYAHSNLAAEIGNVSSRFSIGNSFISQTP